MGPSEARPRRWVAGAAVAAGALLFLFLALRGAARTAPGGGPGPGPPPEVATASGPAVPVPTGEEASGAPDDRPAAPPPEPLPPPAPVTSRVRGIVLAADGSSPVPEALVTILPVGGARATIVAGEDGSFAWSAPAAFAATIRARGPGTGFGKVDVAVAGGEEEVRNLVLAVPVLQPIEVRRGDHAVLAGALVEVTAGDGDAPPGAGVLARGRTDGAGRCTLDLPPDVPLRVRCLPLDHSRESVLAIPRAPGSAVPVVIRFDGGEAGSGASVRARVVDAEGRAVAGVVVHGTPRWAEGGGRIGRTAASAEDGAVVLDARASPEWDLSVRPSRAGDWIHRAPVAAVAGEPVDIPVVRSGGVRILPVAAEGEPGRLAQPCLVLLRGRTPEGTPLPGPWPLPGLRLDEPTEVLLPPGIWCFLVVDLHRVRVGGWREYHVVAGEVIDLGPVSLRRGARARGAVVGPSGSPPRGARVVYLPGLGDDGWNTVHRSTASVDARGTFDTGTVLQQGRGCLVALAEGCAPAAVRLEGIPETGDVDAGVLRLGRGGSLLLRGTPGGSVRISREDGLPCAPEIPGRDFDLPEEALDAHADLDAEGIALVERLAAGTYAARESGRSTPFTIREGRVTTVLLAPAGPR
jgi:hypothetical protein